MGKCAICGQQADTRPYGPNGSDICFFCGIMPEHKQETERQFKTQLAACGDSAIIGIDVGPVPGSPEMLGAVLGYPATGSERGQS